MFDPFSIFAFEENKSKRENKQKRINPNIDLEQNDWKDNKNNFSHVPKENIDKENLPKRLNDKEILKNKYFTNPQNNIIDINFQLINDNDQSIKNDLNIQHSNSNIYLKDICLDCENNLVKCELCEGYFEIKTFYEKHENFCILLHKLYEENGELIECTNCGSFIQFNDFLKHSNICKEQNKKIQTQKIECKFCDLVLPFEMIDKHEETCQKEHQENKIFREKIQCQYCNENVPISYVSSHESTCLKLKENNEKISEVIKNSKVLYPEEWMDNDNLMHILKKDYDEEYLFVEELMRKSMANVKIIEITRIQNKDLWEKYYREKLKVFKEKEECKEKFLFHGSKDINYKIIYVSGFDISFAKEGEEHGRGIYFYKHAKATDGLAFKESQRKYIFLAKVITGKSKRCIPNKNRRKPSFYDRDRFIYYDSITHVNNSQDKDRTNLLYVVYNNEKAYPYYLVEYEAK